MPTNYRKQGNDFEKIAAKYLSDNGYFIKDLNFYCKMGEIDIVALEGEYVVFVEVKYRTNRNKGTGAEAVNFRKMRSICRSADYYLMTHSFSSDTNVRFDVVVIEEGHLNHIKNAFEYIV